MTIELYKNYGVLSAEKRTIYTYGNKSEQDELLYDNDGAPCFLGTDKDGRFFNIELGEERGDKNGN